MKKVVVDIDGILWNMAPAWHEELLKINPDCPFPGVTTWDFYSDYMSYEEAHLAATGVHLKQDTYTAFPGVERLTRIFNSEGVYVVIASHRDPSTKEVTTKWLKNHNIHFDELYTGDNKHEYFDDPEVRLVIDDSPSNQQQAIDKGVQVFSIEYPYNKHMSNVIFYRNFDHLVSGAYFWVHENEQIRPVFGKTTLHLRSIT